MLLCGVDVMDEENSDKDRVPLIEEMLGNGERKSTVAQRSLRKKK